MLLVDEIHAPLVLPGASYVPFGSLDHPMTERAIVFTSATKGWNIPGVKCGVAVAGSPALVALLEERWDALLAAQLGVVASVAAFTSARPWLDAMLAQIDENRRLLTRLLAEQPARRPLRPARGQLPDLAGLPPPGPRRRPLRGVPGARPGRAQPRPALR